MSVTLYDEFDEVAARFGVDIEQVRRDHLLSHVLAAISVGVPTDDVVFFGGTALSRTFLADARLSEDIDLIALAPRTQLAGAIESAVARGLARSHGRVTWQPALSTTSGSQPTTLSVDGVDGIQVQLLAREGYTWPTEVRDIEQRYSDAAPARLRTLTAPAFAAAKLAAWMDRRAPRDLFDQWAMSKRSLIDQAALEAFVHLGPTGRPPARWVFATGPDEATWRRALSHQTRLTITAAEALAAVQAAWSAAAMGR
jgi:predicted nucleotidyltransferase component of viral defense system